MDSVRLLALQKKETTEVLYKGKALYLENEMLVYEEKDSATRLTYDAELHKIIIHRRSEVNSTITLVQNGKSDICVNSPYGEFHLDCKVHQMKVEKNRWFVKYELINNQQSEMFEFAWIIKEE